MSLIIKCENNKKVCAEVHVPFYFIKFSKEIADIFYKTVRQTLDFRRKGRMNRMHRVQNIQIDGANLLDGIGSSIKQESFDFGTVSAGMGRVAETEKLSKGEKTEEVTYQKPQQESKTGTAEDVMQQAENMNTATMKNQMVVASNTTTSADCRQMEEEGFSLQQTDMKTVVTVTDKIKMELAKAGVDISYFGDSLSAEQIEAFAGNAAFAQTLSGRIQHMQADIPLTEDNVTDCKRALLQAEELHKLNDGALKYMLDNQLEPTIANLYKAQYSGSAVYRNQNTIPVDFQGMKEQISKIIAQSGQKEDERTLADSQWLMQNEIALTAENLNYLTQLKTIDVPGDTEKIIDQMITAIADGKRPQDAILLDGFSLAEKAQKAVDIIQQTTDEDLAYVISKGEPVTIQNLEKAHNQNLAGISASEKEEITQLIQNASDAEKNAQMEMKTEDTKTDAYIENADADSESRSIPEMSEKSSAGVTVTNGIPVGSTAPVPQEVPGILLRTRLVQLTSVEITLVAARRQLEEIRMSMTIEASYKMLKNGISLDTSPMEELIAHLKKFEDNFYKSMLKDGGVEATQANVSLFAETSAKLEELKGMPAYALGTRNMQVSTLEELHQEGSAMQQNFQQANERYESMQTGVRKDLGDSIQKAFRNVDDILEQIGQEVSPENERAVRILGYNQIEITPENVAKMKAVDQQVQAAFHNLTPSVVREFIGRGMNPLDMDIRELNQQAEQIKTELHIDAPEDKYSEYLFKLEQNHNISQEERNSYIGIYRLMNHIVETDGAAVGALVEQGAEITMRNLMAAVRTQRRGELDIKVDKSFGELESGGYVDSITDQIESGYQSQCIKQAFHEISPERLRTVTNESGWEDLTPEQFLRQLQEAPEDLAAREAYDQQQLRDLEMCAKSSEEVFHVLEQYEIPNTMLNVMAVSELLHDRNIAFRRLFGTGNGRKPDSELRPDEYLTENEDGSTEVDFEALKEELLRRFGEDVKKPKELAKAVAELAECAEKCMSTMILEPDTTSLDIRGLKLMNAQISIGAKMASSECFSMPIVVDGEVTNVTMKIVRNKEQKGLVNITLDSGLHGKIAAELRAKQKGFSGYVTADSRQTTELLEAKRQEIAEALKEVEDGPLDLNFIMNSRLDLNSFSATSGESEEPESEELREVQTKTLYGMAEAFIRTVKHLERAA